MCGLFNEMMLNVMHLMFVLLLGLEPEDFLIYMVIIWG